MTDRAAIYTRINHTDAKRYGDVTTNRQLAGCATYCVDRGYTVEDAHIFTEVSQARAGAERPVFDALRAAMRSGAVDVVVAQNHTRFGRQQHPHLTFYFSWPAPA
jgi:DNA invertase Pin-like site-specific DNA recombinase